MWLNNEGMSVQHKEKEGNYYSELKTPEKLQRRVDVNDLVSKMNDDKKRERKNSLIMGAAAVSAVTVFGIILTL